MFGYLIQHEKLMKIVIEEKMEEKRGPERLRRTFLDQIIKDQADAMPYKEEKTLTEDLKTRRPSSLKNSSPTSATVYDVE